ncbi:MAG TPA: hypothetical protein VKF62_03535 [Planctomycetota bacterium]|nr:hypothetical protein [Planctomycetota bacterium]
MRIGARVVLCVASALAIVLLFPVDGSAGPHPAAALQKKTKVVLQKRTGDDYGNAGYSFLFSSRDPAVHRNYVDLLLNSCGLLHFNPYTSCRNRVASLGKVEFAGVKKLPTEGWLKTSVRPVEGSVYVFEGGISIPEITAKYAVKFVVTEVKVDSVTIEWAPLGDMPKAPGEKSRTAPVTAMGRCGTPPHDES